MSIWKKAAAFLLAAALAVGTPAAVYADPGSGAVIIDPGTEEPSAGDSGTGEAASGTVESGTGESEDSLPDSGVDLSDTDYQPIDLTGYTQWDGKSAMQPGVNYYISGAVKPKNNVTLPEGSTLVVTKGSQLVIYKGKALGVRGNLIIEPGADVTISGKLTVYAEAGLENYGRLSGTVSSDIRIASELINRRGADTVFSGNINIYSGGMYLNYGSTNLTSNAVMKVTGEIQTPVGGRLYCRGYMAITISGHTTQAGYFSLSGRLVNSGVFIFETTVKYYKSKSASFAVSKSSRLIDYRYNNGTIPNNDGDDGSSSENVTDVGNKGIDVSYAQGAIDWAKVKASGVDFAIIRASRGALDSTRPIAKDKMFDYNAAEATKYGIKIGVYHYLYATTVSEARKEARFFIRTIEPYDINYPVVLDIEEEYQAKLGKSTVTKIVKAFLDEIKDAGYYAMLYANKTWLTERLDMSQLSEYDVWLAQWNSVPTYKGEFGIWQYSSKGIVSGIDGYVDLNISYKNYAKIIKDGGYKT